MANRVSHPKNVSLKESDVLGHIDDWLRNCSAPSGIDAGLNAWAQVLHPDVAQGLCFASPQSQGRNTS